MTFEEFLKIIYFIPLFEIILLDTIALWLCADVHIHKDYVLGRLSSLQQKKEKTESQKLRPIIR